MNKNKKAKTDKTNKQNISGSHFHKDSLVLQVELWCNCYFCLLCVTFLG